MKQPTGPRKFQAETTDLTGQQLAQVLRYYGVSQARFARHTGRHEKTMQRWLDRTEDDEGLPLWIEWILMMYELHPESRTLDGRLPLPRGKWGIDGDERSEPQGPTPANPWATIQED
jgi:hypothetical protein